MKKLKKEDLKHKILVILQFVLNPRFLLCFGIAWMITNGWSYVLMLLGTLLSIRWMIAVSGAYLAFLWLPITPEKIITIAISIELLRRLFPDDEKTLRILLDMHAKVKHQFKRYRRARRIQKAIRHADEEKNRQLSSEESEEEE